MRLVCTSKDTNDVQARDGSLVHVVRLCDAGLALNDGSLAPDTQEECGDDASLQRTRGCLCIWDQFVGGGEDKGVEIIIIYWHALCCVSCDGADIEIPADPKGAGPGA